jgi:L-alanine-DL-glutamate epimerase-like enolase superfamily enzyme
MQRRDFMKSASALALVGPLSSSAAVLAAESPKFKVTDIRVRKIRVVKDIGVMEQASLNPPLRYSFSIGGGTFMEVHTDQGLVGIGPGIDPETLNLAKSLLIGNDPFDITNYAFQLYNPGRRGGANVEIALWDLIGKVANQPLYKLWRGGIAGLPVAPDRNKVMPYASQWTMGGP